MKLNQRTSLGNHHVICSQLDPGGAISMRYGIGKKEKQHARRKNSREIRDKLKLLRNWILHECQK